MHRFIDLVWTFIKFMVSLILTKILWSLCRLVLWILKIYYVARSQTLTILLFSLLLYRYINNQHKEPKLEKKYNPANSYGVQSWQRAHEPREKQPQTSSVCEIWCYKNLFRYSHRRCEERCSWFKKSCSCSQRDHTCGFCCPPVCEPTAFSKQS